jgi:uncharacterized membrane protein
MLSRPLLQVLTLQWLVDPLPLLASALALVLLLVLTHHLPSDEMRTGQRSKES